MAIPPRQRLLITIAVAFVAQMAEVGVFAGGYGVLGIFHPDPALTGSLEGGAFDFLYFSASTYTTLGISVGSQLCSSHLLSHHVSWKTGVHPRFEPEGMLFCPML